MLLDAKGHLKLTDLGLCKKVGDVSPEDHPEVVLEMLGKQSGKELRGVQFMDEEEGSGEPPTTKRVPPKTKREMAYSTVGTPDYIAPEVLAAQNGSSGFSYTVAVDWWSLGVKERYPFDGISKEKFHKLSREDQILSQVCNHFFNVNFVND